MPPDKNPASSSKRPPAGGRKSPADEEIDRLLDQSSYELEDLDEDVLGARPPGMGAPPNPGVSEDYELARSGELELPSLDGLGSDIPYVDEADEVDLTGNTGSAEGSDYSLFSGDDLGALAAGTDDGFGGDDTTGDSSISNSEEVVLGRPARKLGGSGEYELESLDGRAIDVREQLAREEVRRAASAIDINEAYDRHHNADPIAWPPEGIQFRFQIKHLLIGTAIFAVFMSMVQIRGLIAALVSLAMMTLISAHLYIAWQERLREEAISRKRRADRIRSQGMSEGLSDAEIEAEIAQEIGPPPAERQFTFNFSLKQVMIAMTASAVLLWLIQLTGGAYLIAVVFGLIALAGLAANLIGYEPPPTVAIGWWILLMCYVLFSMIAPSLMASG